MTASTDSRLTPGKRLGRGLAHTAGGPVDITRGALGVTAQAVASAIGGIRRRYREGRLRRELEAAQQAIGRELAAAQGVLAALPESYQDARAKRGHTKRPWLLAGAAVGVLAVGGAAFALVRHRARPTEPSTLPPSVQVEPKV